MGRKIIDNPNACSLVHAMNMIGGKWKPIILYLLSNGSLRFGKLLMFIPMISRKVLTEQLRELEEDGLIIREKFNEIPPRVEYRLSEKGRGLKPVLKMLSDWAFEAFPGVDFEACKIAS